MKYFIYIRKSSDREDAQMLSIEAQTRSLTNFAKEKGLEIVGTFSESASAYKAGRPMFNEVLARLEAGEADAILVYHLTRIARNSYDGGRVIYMMDEDVIKEIRTPEKSYFAEISDDKFMMNIHFAMAKKSSDDTSQFVKRDIGTKITKGEYPLCAPIGYLNIDKFGRISGKRYTTEKQEMLDELAKRENRALRRIEIDPILGPIIKQAFEYYTAGNRTSQDVREFTFAQGLTGQRSDKMITQSTVQAMLTNPMYYGALPIKGEVHSPENLPEETRHLPIITKQLFDLTQEKLGIVAKPRKTTHDHAYRGLMTCGECGCSITSELQRGKVYYRCSKKRNTADYKCSQKYVREDLLEEQMHRKIQELVMPQEIAQHALTKLSGVHQDETKRIIKKKDDLQRAIRSIDQKLSGLLKFKISPDNTNGEMMSDEEYMNEKSPLLEQKQLLTEELGATEQSIDNWLEQVEKYFDFATQCGKLWERGTSEDRHEIFTIMFGSNATLMGQEVNVTIKKPFLRTVDCDKNVDWRE